MFLFYFYVQMVRLLSMVITGITKVVKSYSLIPILIPIYSTNVSGYAVFSGNSGHPSRSGETEKYLLLDGTKIQDGGTTPDHEDQDGRLQKLRGGATGGDASQETAPRPPGVGDDQTQDEGD